MSSRPLVIYHSADFDGLFCREIARKHFGDGAEYLGWNYGDPVPVVGYDRDLFILDLSIAALMAHPRLVWIDHHKTAIDRYPHSIPGYRIDGVAACRLAWQWFFGDASSQRSDYVAHRVKEPIAVTLAGEYDIWDKRDPRAELFQHGLKSRDLAEVWWRLLTFDPCVVDELLDAGKVLAYAREQEYAHVIAEQGFTVQFEGLTFLACCSHECDIRSHLFAAGIKPEHEGLLGFTWTGGDWRVSLYGVPGKPEIDLSAIAAKRGGGGHKQACGFRADVLPFVQPRALQPYHELVYAVARKFEGETRHETALRYIRRAEEIAEAGPAASIPA